jgi:hypothetical protein
MIIRPEEPADVYKGLKTLYYLLMLCSFFLLQSMYDNFLYFFVLCRKSHQGQMEKEIIFHYVKDNY